jgi:TolB-like protein/DNA-binding winged helix-turn-helix (wHTH) protein/Flp pilus assembly protein TadD
MDLLILLVERRPDLVSRDEIVDRLWGKDVFVDVETGIHGAIRKIRLALRDVPERPMCVETVPGRGYRFIAPTEAPADTPETQPSPVSPTTVAEAARIPDTVPPPPREPESSFAADPAESHRPFRRLTMSRVWGASVAALMIAALLTWRWYASDASASRVMLAVLPFENLSGDPDRDYLADGLWEEMVVALDNIDPQRVGVLGRSSIRDYQRGLKSPAALGRELGVDYLVDNSIRSEKGRLRIVAKLIRVRDQVQIWSEAYDREPASVLDMQTELSAAIAAQIGLRLAPDRVAALGRRQTPNPDAYDLYLRGRYFENRRTPPTTAKAIEYFQQATTLDPDYALAWSSMSLAYAARAINSDVPPDDVTRLAQEAARQAVRADSSLAEAQLARAYVAWILDWDWATAEAALRRAVSLDPRLATAHQVLGHLLSQMGKHDEAEASLRRARELEPLEAMPLAMSSQVAFQARDYAAALGYAMQAIALDSQLWIGHMMRGQALERMGRHAPALDALTTAAGFSEGNSKATSLRGYDLARTGRDEDARRVLTALEAAAQQQYVPPYAFALIYAGLAQPDAVFAWLQRAHAARDVHLIFLTVDPKWDPYRADPRFIELLRRCGFTRGATPLATER